MSKLQHYLLQVIFKKLFKQSEIHEINLVHVYILIRESLQKEFTEDSLVCLEEFSKECHNKAWWNKSYTKTV